MRFFSGNTTWNAEKIYQENLAEQRIKRRRSNGLSNWGKEDLLVLGHEIY
jgi:hypothetical protein